MFVKRVPEEAERNWGGLSGPGFGARGFIRQSPAQEGVGDRCPLSSSACVTSTWGNFIVSEEFRRGLDLWGEKKQKNKKPVLGAGSRGPMFDHFILFGFQQQHEYSSYLFVN